MVCVSMFVFQGGDLVRSGVAVTTRLWSSEDLALPVSSPQPIQLLS